MPPPFAPTVALSTSSALPPPPRPSHRPLPPPPTAALAAASARRRPSRLHHRPSRRPPPAADSPLRAIEVSHSAWPERRLLTARHLSRCPSARMPPVLLTRLTCRAVSGRITHSATAWPNPGSAGGIWTPCQLTLRAAVVPELAKFGDRSVP